MNLKIALFGLGALSLTLFAFKPMNTQGNIYRSIKTGNFELQRVHFERADLYRLEELHRKYTDGRSIFIKTAIASKYGDILDITDRLTCPDMSVYQLPYYREVESILEKYGPIVDVQTQF